MLDKLRDLIQGTAKSDVQTSQFDATDLQLAQAALMFHVIAADGVVYDEEKDRLHQILETRYELSSDEAGQLIEEAHRADTEATGLYKFTSILKRQLDHEKRLELVENLWEMVYADGDIHELEDNVVWRIAELLAIDKRERMDLKRKVRDNVQAGS